MEACPKCGKREMTFTTAQLRSADEGQTIFYTCQACSHKYNLNSWRGAVDRNGRPCTSIFALPPPLPFNVQARTHPHTPAHALALYCTHAMVTSWSWTHSHLPHTQTHAHTHTHARTISRLAIPGQPGPLTASPAHLYKQRDQGNQLNQFLQLK